MLGNIFGGIAAFVASIIKVLWIVIKLLIFVALGMLLVGILIVMPAVILVGM